jgi:hypothetical protein
MIRLTFVVTATMLLALLIPVAAMLGAFLGFMVAAHLA